jgi:XTP/dITP diphosphohydrolase
MKTIYFATNNLYKFEEVKEVANDFGIKIENFKCNIRELQTINRRDLIKHKTLEAFSIIHSPVIVDHASLEIVSLNGIPGTLTQLFWDKLEGKICDIVSSLGNNKATAISTIGYCDGKKVYFEEGEVEGEITKKPVGLREFQWDTIFIPNGETRTYGEMNIIEKNEISQRKIALIKMFKKIKSR